MEDKIASVILALISGLPTLLAVILANRSHDKVNDEKMKNIDEKISTLAKNVEKHNNLVERMVVVEQSAKSAHHRIDDVVSQLKITEKRK